MQRMISVLMVVVGALLAVIATVPWSVPLMVFWLGVSLACTGSLLYVEDLEARDG